MKVICHCGNVVIKVEKPDQVTQCNYSICSRYMTLWGYYSDNEPEITIGAEGIDSYSWGDKVLDFMRCAKCGCVTHYKTRPELSKQKIAVNFGLIRDKMTDVPVRYFKGAEEL